MANELTEQQKTCKHEEQIVQCMVNHAPDTGMWDAAIQIICSQCQLPFHFVAPDYGMRRDRPALNPDATELRCPIGPGPAELPPMGTPMRFEMPDVKPRES